MKQNQYFRAYFSIIRLFIIHLAVLALNYQRSLEWCELWLFWFGNLTSCQYCSHLLLRPQLLAMLIVSTSSASVLGMKVTLFPFVSSMSFALVSKMWITMFAFLYCRCSFWICSWRNMLLIMMSWDKGEKFNVKILLIIISILVRNDNQSSGKLVAI